MKRVKSVVFAWLGLGRSSDSLPPLDVDVEVDFLEGSFVAPNAWHRATGRSPDLTDPVCRLSFGVSPLLDRIYVDGLWVEEHLRRQGYASALLLAVAKRMSPPGTLLPITALHEVRASDSFWSALRTGAVSDLNVTMDVRVSEMAEEAQRWRQQVGPRQSS